MKKVFAIAMLGLLVSVSACGPKAQSGGTTVAPPMGDPATSTGGAAPAGGAPTGAAPPMNANPGTAPTAP